MSNKSGEMGLGLLIVLIAFMIVAAITAAAVITTSNSLRSAATQTFKEASDRSSNFIQIIMMDATDGTEGVLNDFSAQVRLLPGSGSIDLNQTLIIFRNRNDTAMISYSPLGNNANYTNDATGFQTFRELELHTVRVWNDTLTQGLAPRISDITATCTSALGCLELDFDEDGVTDTVRTCCNDVGCPAAVNETHLRVDLSTAGSAYVPLYDAVGAPVTADLCSANPITILNEYTPIEVDNVTYGYFYIDVTTTNDDSVDCTGACNGAMEGVYAFLAAEELPDVNLDGVSDYLFLNKTHAVYWLSNNTAERQVMVEVPINGGAQWSAVATSFSLNQVVGYNGQTLGRLTAQGTVATVDEMPSSASLTFLPDKVNRGWYSAETLVQGPDYRGGYINPGDVLRLHYESPAPVDGTDRITVGLVSNNHEYYASQTIDLFEFESIQRVIVFP